MKIPLWGALFTELGYNPVVKRMGLATDDVLFGREWKVDAKINLAKLFDLLFRPWLLPATCGITGILTLLFGSVWADYDERYPRIDTLFHATYADAGRAVWGSTDERPDAWTAAYLTSEPETKDLSGLFPGSTTRMPHSVQPA